MDSSTIAAIVTSIGTGLVGFLAGKKRSDAEVEAISLKNVEQALTIYKDMLNDMKVRYDQEIDALKSRIKSYESHITNLENQIKQLKKK
jgi:polyhydroxyalkanoate synthesis regulator phasin